MERPPNIPEVVWATMTPELRATVIAALQQKEDELAKTMQQALQQNTDEVTKQVTKQVTEQVTKKMRDEFKLSNLLQLGGPEADSAKALLKAATSDTHSIADIVQSLKALEVQVEDRATQAKEDIKRARRDLLLAIDRRLEHLLGVVKLSRNLQIDAIHETIAKLEGCRSLITRAEDIAQTTLIDKTFAAAKAQIELMLPKLEAGKKVLHECSRHAARLSSELALRARFDEGNDSEDEDEDEDEGTIVMHARRFTRARIFSRGATKGPFSLGQPMITNLILYMASPNSLDDHEGRRRWSQMMLLVAGKEMEAWSEVEKETGLVPAAEVAPYAWAHRFLPQEAAKVSGGADASAKVPLPWLNLVARGAVLKWKWNRVSNKMNITEGGKRLAYKGDGDYAGAVAEPQVTQGSHWFEVQIIDELDVHGDIMIGWSPAGVGVDDDKSIDDVGGSTW